MSSNTDRQCSARGGRGTLLARNNSSCSLLPSSGCGDVSSSATQPTTVIYRSHRSEHVLGTGTILHDVKRAQPEALEQRVWDKLAKAATVRTVHEMRGETGRLARDTTAQARSKVNSSNGTRHAPFHPLRRARTHSPPEPGRWPS